MSFNAKNLHYEKQEPAFLRRLRGQNFGSNDRNKVQFARPRKQRLGTEHRRAGQDGDDDDDGPVIIDEEGEHLTQREYKDLVEGKTQEVDATEVANEEEREKQNPSIVGAASCINEKEEVDLIQDRHAVAISRTKNGFNKRKRGKIVAVEPQSRTSNDHYEDEMQRPTTINTATRLTKRDKKKTEKRSKMQLSFDDDNE